MSVIRDRTGPRTLDLFSFLPALADFPPHACPLQPCLPPLPTPPAIYRAWLNGLQDKRSQSSRAGAHQAFPRGPAVSTFSPAKGCVTQREQGGGAARPRQGAGLGPALRTLWSLLRPTDKLGFPASAVETPWDGSRYRRFPRGLTHP